MFTKWRTVCGFVVGLFVPFASMYVADSIAVQAIYLENVMTGISTSQIGFLSSVLNFPSMIMTMLAAPFVDKLGPLITGIFFNVWFLAMSIAMYFVWDKYTPLLVFRLLFGIMYEPSWLAQLSVISTHLQKSMSLGFGLCISISTSANLIGYFAIPQIMKGLDYEQDPEKYRDKLHFTFTLNIIVSGIMLLLVILGSIPLISNEKIFVRKMRKLQAERRLQQKDKSCWSKFKTYFTFKLDVWLNSATLTTLLGSCFGGQTMMINYINANQGD